MVDQGDLLQAACNEALSDPALRPVYSKDGTLLTTFCNMGVRTISAKMGCHELDDLELTADDMIKIFLENKSGKWWVLTAPDGGREATLYALNGGVAIGFMSSARMQETHAHVAVVYPESMTKSGSLGRDVPILTNIGRGDPDAPLVNATGNKRTRPNVRCKASAAFPVSKGECDYALWTADKT